jgi:GNAT superfamily N-acetyltransferase
MGNNTNEQCVLVHYPAFANPALPVQVYVFFGIFPHLISLFRFGLYTAWLCLRGRPAGKVMANSGDSPITLEVVTERAQWRQFLALPHRLYATDPAWVAPLDFEQRQRFSPANHFFDHARWRAWLALRGGVVVGRITAQIDEMHLRQHADGAGYFGMLEAEDDPAVFAALLEAAAQWLRSEGMQRVRGPLNLHINEEVGLLVEGFSTPPFVLMGHARPYYGAGIEGQGYRGVKDLLAYHIRPDFEPPRVMTKLAERVSDRVKVRAVRRKQLGEDAQIMLGIFNDAWEKNWGFVPLVAAEWEETVRTLAKLMPDDYIQIAEYDGEPVAFIVALPNLNEAIADLKGKLLPFGWAKLLWRLKVRHPQTARIPLMGVRQSFQHSRLGPTLAFMVIDAVRKAMHARGVKNVEMGWILEDNDGMRNIIETIGGQAYKRYRVYEKEL